MNKKTSFKNIKGRESHESLLWSARLQKFIELNPVEYPSSFNDILEIIGVSIDMESVSKYQRVHAFLINQRKKTDALFKILVDDGWFNKYISEGLTEEQIYDKFIGTCLSYNLIPLYYDVDDKYKLIDLSSFILIKQERIRSTCKEIATKIEILQNHSSVLPNAVTSSMDQLRGEESPLLKARDRLNTLLPSSEPED